MGKGQVGRYLLTGIMVIILLVIISLVTMYVSPNDVERAYRWLLLLVGLTTIIFSLIKLLAAGAADITAELFSKWIILIFLGMLILEATKYLVLSIAIILVALIVISYLKGRKKIAEVPEQ